MGSHALVRNEMEIPHALYPVSLNLHYCHGDDSIARCSQAVEHCHPLKAAMPPFRSPAQASLHPSAILTTADFLSLILSSSKCYIYGAAWNTAFHSSISFLAVFMCVSLRSKHRALNMQGYCSSTEPYTD